MISSALANSIILLILFLFITVFFGIFVLWFDETRKTIIKTNEKKIQSDFHDKKTPHLNNIRLG